MLRYEIDSCRRGAARDVLLLERAFARVAGEWADRVRGIVVSGPTGGSLSVAMDVVGSPVLASRECERLFALAWYDAFGVWGTTHLGRLVEEPAPPGTSARVLSGSLK